MQRIIENSLTYLKQHLHFVFKIVSTIICAQFIAMPSVKQYMNFGLKRKFKFAERSSSANVKAFI